MKWSIKKVALIIFFISVLTLCFIYTVFLIKSPGFIIPGVSPKYYAQDSVIPVMTYGLFSPNKHPNEPISYKNLPVCAPLQGWSAVDQTLGEMLKHEEILYTFYYIMVGTNITDPTLTVCSTYLSTQPFHRYNQLKTTYEAIRGDYKYIFTLDGLEILYPNIDALDRYHIFGDMTLAPIPDWPDTMIPTITYENLVTNSSSTISESTDSDESDIIDHSDVIVVIDDSNAYKFPMIPDDVMQNSKTTIGLPVGFIVSKHNDPRGPRGYYMYQHYNFYIYYNKEEDKKIVPSDDIWSTLTNEQRTTGRADVTYIIRFEGYPDPRSALLVLPVDGNYSMIPDTIKTTYGYVWIEDSSNWVSRWSSLLYSSKTRVDVMAIIDIVTIGIMSGIVFLLIIFLWWHISSSMKFKLTDFIHNNGDRTWLCHFDATQWRHMGIDFFREPIFSGLAILLMSSGVQCISSVIITLVAGCIGLFFGNFRGGLDETLLFVYIFMYILGGIISGFFKYTWSRSDKIRNRTFFIIITWMIFPAIPLWFFLFSTFSLHFIVGTPLPDIDLFLESILVWGILTLTLTIIGFVLGADFQQPNSMTRPLFKFLYLGLCFCRKNKKKPELEMDKEVIFTDLETHAETRIELSEIKEPDPSNQVPYTSEIRDSVDSIFTDVDNTIKKITENTDYTNSIINDTLNSVVPVTKISTPPDPKIQLQPRPFDDDESESGVYKPRKYYDKWKDDVLTEEKIQHKTMFIPKLWSKTKWLWTFIFGFISYMMVCVSIHTFLRSSWGPFTDTMYLTTLINMLTWCVFVVTCSAMFVYIHLNNRDWRWFWSCFIFSGSCAFYYFLHTIFYLIISGMSGLVTIIYFMLFSLLTTCAMFISMGSIGCIVTYFVFRKLYHSAISKDD